MPPCGQRKTEQQKGPRERFQNQKTLQGSTLQHSWGDRGSGLRVQHQISVYKASGINVFEDIGLPNPK